MKRSGSLRQQLIAWNILALALLLGVLGVSIRLTVRSFLLTTVDAELERSLRFSPGPPPNGGGPHGNHGGGRPPDDRRPPGGDDGGPPDEFAPNGAEAPGGHGGGPPRSPTFDNQEVPQGFNIYGAHHWSLQKKSLLASDPRPLLDPQGFALAAQGKSHFATLTLNNEPVRVLSEPARQQGRMTAVVQIAHSLTDTEQALAGVDRALLTLIPLGLLGAGLGGAFLTDRVLRRVRHTTQAAKQISAHDFGQRLPVMGNDEFSALAQTFNGLLERQDAAFRAQQTLLEQQRRFTADASHELKTPLTVIKGTASLGLSGDRDAPAYRRLLGEIDLAADTMGHLVQDLLLLARSDGGQMGRDPIVLPIGEILGRAVSGLPRANRAPVLLTVANEALCVLGNETELTRLFSNLVENAIRHTPTDGIIQVNARTEHENLVVAVSDTGAGIAPEHLPHLGERFYRVDAARARPDGGTGLGLSICKGIVHAHGGAMEITSAIGAGTTVRITFPQPDESLIGGGE